MRSIKDDSYEVEGVEYAGRSDPALPFSNSHAESESSNFDPSQRTICHASEFIKTAGALAGSLRKYAKKGIAIKEKIEDGEFQERVSNAIILPGVMYEKEYLRHHRDW